MKKVALVIFLLGALNFVTCMVIAQHLGGDAVNGKEENGRYYLAEHGHITEVSKAVFTYSRYHNYSILITHPLATLGIIIFGALKKGEDDAKKKSA